MPIKKPWVAALLILSAAAAAVLGYRSFADPNINRVVYYPAENDEVLFNPYMGWVGDARDREMRQPVRLVFAKLTWREAEPRKGEYDWASFEDRNHFEFWEKQNVKIILRPVLDYPQDEDHLDIPDWLYDEIGGQGTHYDLEYGKGFSPDYANPILIQEHEKWLRAFAETYDDDPRIAFIQLGSVGHWAEWHTWGDEPERIPFPPRSVTDRYAEAYIKHFHHKPLLMRRPMEIASRNGMGLYNDAFGNTEATIDGFLNWYTNGYESWLTGEREPAMPDFWTRSPSGGEFVDPVYYLQNDRLEETIRQARMTHVSWLGPSAPVDEPADGPLQANIDRFLKTIGYRFVLTSESHEETANAGGILHVQVNIRNRGVAPFYFPWPFELALADAEGRIVTAVTTDADIRKWLPGEHEVNGDLKLPNDLSPGVYTLTAAILDPETGLPGIDFANEGRRTDGRYSLGTVNISP